MLHTPPQFVDVTPELNERMEKFRQEHAADLMGDVGTRLLFEDDKVRIWEMRLEPGEASDLHHHEHVYYLVVFQGDLVAGIPPIGNPVEPFVARVPLEGNTVGIPKGGTEWALNVGEKTYYEILVELKDT